VSDTAHLYMFRNAPPAEPKLYFPETKLLEMATWGHMACPYRPPQYTIYPGDGQVGRWTLHFDHPDPLTDTSPWKFSIDDMLPGMRMHYEDFETGQRWVWVLTSQRLYGEPNWRLGMWPD
jgi:hypothetical protein